MTDPLLDREVRRRLAVLRHVEEVTGNVAMTCRALRHQPPALVHLAPPIPSRRTRGSADPVHCSCRSHNCVPRNHRMPFTTMHRSTSVARAPVRRSTIARPRWALSTWVRLRRRCACGAPARGRRRWRGGLPRRAGSGRGCPGVGGLKAMEMRTTTIAAVTRIGRVGYPHILIWKIRAPRAPSVAAGSTGRGRSSGRRRGRPRPRS